MTGSILNPGSSTALTQLFAKLVISVGETLASLLGRDLVAKAIETTLTDSEELIGSLPRTYVVARAELDKDFANRSMWILIDIRDAIAMSGMLLQTPDDVIEQRRSECLLDSRNAEAFGELGNVMFSGMAAELRENIKKVDLRYDNYEQIKPSGLGADSTLVADTLVFHAFSLKVADFPETVAYMATDATTGEAWNGKPLELQADEAPDAEEAAGSTKVDEEVFEGIPAAPICGVLAAFVTLPEVYRTLRQSCRRVGLELQRHGRSDIPNPAAHREHIVLLDIPVGEDRQFDWCKRIKDFAPETKVVLLIHHPSRNRVTQAFLSKADAILGLPCNESQLSQKLTAVMDTAPATPEPE